MYEKSKYGKTKGKDCRLQGKFTGEEKLAGCRGNLPVKRNLPVADKIAGMGKTGDRSAIKCRLNTQMGNTSPVKHPTNSNLQTKSIKILLQKSCGYRQWSKQKKQILIPVGQCGTVLEISKIKTKYLPIWKTIICQL
jgi:hypothetical protein